MKGLAPKISRSAYICQLAFDLCHVLTDCPAYLDPSKATGIDEK